ncbi:MAG TPA: transketolase [Polyangiaceae bacterium]|nr:transketolase [Polyangiaceae bacterium]
MSAYEQAVKTVRFLSIDAVEQANSGHPGTPMALAGIGVELFTRHLRYHPRDPGWINRDRFVLSCGHASMLLYSLLHLAGYDLELEDLKQFRQWGSKTPGHPEYGYTAGVETTTGPLGQGVGNAVGMALAGKMAAARVNTPEQPIIDYKVYAICSDGDLMEGVANEAASFAGHLKLDNLILIYDDNRITIDGSTSLSFSEDVGLRFQALGWAVQHVDGHDAAAVRAALDRAKLERGRPSFIVARTHIGYGAPNKQDSSAAHGAPLGADEVRATKQAADWPLEPFHVPEEARKPFAERVEQNLAEYERWQATAAGLKGDQAARLKQLSERQLPSDLFEQLLRAAEGKPDATRSLAAKVQQRAAALLPALVGGSADLAESVKTLIKDAGHVGPGEFAGRNLHFGVREHGMGAVLNGMALSGFFIPYGSTFLIFSDYMRPSVRLAALMHQQVIFVYSHDSVFLGEDGPTHQPIEQIATLRLVPNLEVLRPADGVECAAAWTRAIERRDGPTAIILTRQKLPALPRPAGFDPKLALRGAYAVVDTEQPDLVLIATGSEVHVAVQAAQALAERKQLSVRVISAPCWELFERWPAEEQERLLPRGVRRVAIEAGRASSWRSVVGPDGITISVDRFGASAPWERLAEELGLTGERVARTIEAAL